MKTKPTGLCAGEKFNNAGDRVAGEENTGQAGDFEAIYEGNEGRETGRSWPQEVAAPAWMSSGLIERTHTVWEKRYGRTLDRDEVLEILHNVRWFGEILRRGFQGEKL